MTIPLIVADLGLSAQPEREAAGGVLPRLRHHLDPGGHAGADRRWEGQIFSFCNFFGDGLMLTLAPLATATATASVVNAMAVAFFAAGTRPACACTGDLGLIKPIGIGVKLIGMIKQACPFSCFLPLFSLSRPLSLFSSAFLSVFCRKS